MNRTKFNGFDQIFPPGSTFLLFITYIYIANTSWNQVGGWFGVEFNRIRETLKPHVITPSHNPWCRLHHNHPHPPPTTVSLWRPARDMSVALLAFLLQCLGWMFQSCMDLTMWDLTCSVLSLVFRIRSFLVASLSSFWKSLDNDVDVFCRGHFPPTPSFVLLSIRLDCYLR